MVALSSSADDSSDIPSYKRLALSLCLGVLAACLVLCLYLMFFAHPTRSAAIAFILSVAGVSTALFTGPWAVVQILLGVRGAYYAFVAVTGLLVCIAVFYAQLKYLPRRFFVFLAGADIFILILLLGWARVIAW